jgi:poly-beta-hydroxyalkanoate depolymerase
MVGHSMKPECILPQMRSAAPPVGHHEVFSGRRWEERVYPIVGHMILILASR